MVDATTKVESTLPIFVEAGASTHAWRCEDDEDDEDDDDDDDEDDEDD